MTAKRWKSKIKKAANAAGTYRPYFDAAIDTLADILARRDEALAQYDAEGRELIVEHTGKTGAVNREQNPLVRLINDLNRDALAYWRDLGLTPSGLKRINEDSLRKPEKASALETALLKFAQDA